MLCDYCRKREAVFFIEQTTKNTRKRINICMECAVKNGLAPDPQRVQKTIRSLFESVEKADAAYNVEAGKLCPVCGKSLAAIKKTGRAGCPECYEIFKTELVDIMERHGIKGQYTGSLPRRIASFRSSLTDRIDLKAKLDLSVQNEDYEKAAIYRDYLRALEKQSVADGSQSEEENKGDE
ncbi:MAG: UvrB/UvrC motif-containing protein [Treponema sp.]|nr:UvrB/UvrC motif-containing protein [Treponema sp.]